MANVNIRLGNKSSAWFTANPTLVLLSGQLVFLDDQSGQYKLGDGTTQLSALSFLGGGGSGLTSVGITGSDFSITGSPLTSNGSILLTLASVNSNVGTFNNVTVNAKGLVTSASNVSYLTSLTGTTNRITVSGSTIDIASTYVGQSSITTLGTIGTGVWQGTSIGTGYTDAKIKGTIAVNQVGYGSGSDTLTGTNNFTYISNVLNLGTSFPLIKGYNTDYDPILTIARTVDYTTNQNSHGFVDATVFSKTTTNLANNAFTDNGQICDPVGSVGNYNHHCCFQSQFKFVNTGTTKDYFFACDGMIMTSGTLTNRYGLYFADSSGAGTITNQYGLFIPTISKGATINEAIHVVSNDSWFGGRIKMATTSGSANVVAPEIAWYHASTAKTSWIADKIINNTSELKFNVSLYNFTGYKEMLTLRGDDTNTSADYALLNANKSFVGGTTAPTAILDISAATSDKAAMRLRSGTAPTSPNDGDIWFDGTDLKIRVSGVTKTFVLV